MSETKECIKLDSGLIKQLTYTLKEKGFKILILNNEEEVIEFIHQIPNDVIIGLGDSITTCTLKIRNILSRKGSLIFYGWNGDIHYNRSLETFEDHPVPEYFLTRVNAITLKGNLLIKDYSRKAIMENHFPKNIIAFAGCNRIVGEFRNQPGMNKYGVFREKPSSVDFTVVLLPYITY
ncbi:MAG: LUD domain-containing protein [Bacteroidales bacterium]|nr:LUD domain-containing protein [Bacteroidales bacterium]